MSSSKNLEFEKTSFLSKANSAFIEQMYLKFINKDTDLPEDWLNYFESIGEEIHIIAKEINGPSWGPKKKIDIDEITLDTKKSSSKIDQNDLIKSNSNSIKAVALIRSYRQRGHLIAKLDPLSLLKTEYLDELHPESYGFKKTDYDKNIYLDGVINKKISSIREILNFLKKNLLWSYWF